jgi:hypothetical protein
MRRGIDEGADPDHPPHIHQEIEARDPSQRRNGERRHEEDQRPVAGAMDDIVEGTRPEALGVEIIDRDSDRHAEEHQGGDPQRRRPSGAIAPDLPGRFRPDFGCHALDRRIGHGQAGSTRPEPPPITLWLWTRYGAMTPP